LQVSNQQRIRYIMDAFYEFTNILEIIHKCGLYVDEWFKRNE